MERMDRVIADLAYLLDCMRNLKSIYESGDCNVCYNKECEWKPKCGEQVRYNCPHYKPMFTVGEGE